MNNIEDPILELNHLCKQYQDFRLDDISFKMSRGYVMGFIGPNGSGKTTTLKLIMNLKRRDHGEIKIFGLDNITAEKEIKNRIGFVYDESCFYGVLTIEDMKKLIAPHYTHWDENEFVRLLKEFDLPPKKKIDDLSKGMKTKFALAIALSHHAELIIMDEPTSGLDPIFRSELLDILYNVIQDENKAILFSTHITSDLEKIADQITFINQGKLVFSQDKDDILERYYLVKGPLEVLADQKTGFVSVRKSNIGFEGLTEDPGKIRQLFSDRVVIEKPSLEEIMVYSVKKTVNSTARG